MTKEEKIKEAYCEHWEELNIHVDKNGWCKSNWKIVHDNLLDTVCRQKPNERWRPKSLQGIENNNGWIKIESENDLPTNTEVYHHGIMNGEVICFKLQHPLNLKRIYDDFQKDNVTHYQPITKPKPPIY